MNKSTFEQFGVDTISDSQRNAKPNSIITMLLGGNLSMSVMIFGWLAISYGLDFWSSVSSVFVGTLFGSAIVAWTSLLGYRSATNNSVTSGAFFGVRGRLIASTIGLLLCLQYLALTIWTGGDVLSSAIARLTGVSSSNTLTITSYFVIGALVVLIAMFGFQKLLQANTFVMIVMLITIVVLTIGLWGNFDPSYPGDPNLYALGSYGPTWLLSAITTGVAGPISYVTLTGDWSRYISPNKYSAKQVVSSTFIGLFVANFIPILFGIFISTIFFNPDSFAAGVVDSIPAALLVPALIVGLVGSVGQGSVNLYSMGLDLDAILPKLSRTQSTLAVAALSTVLVLFGKFAYNLEASVTNLALFLTSLATSWATITLYGYWKNKGKFDQDALQVFNNRKTGGKYWFNSGWNLTTIMAWVIGSIAGILGISSLDYVGPIANFFGALDLSVPLSGLVGLGIYAILGRKNVKTIL
jgi:purine-cytosine permease-like protein